MYFDDNFRRIAQWVLAFSNVELPPFTNRCQYVYLEHTYCQVKVQFPRFVCPEGDSTMLKVGKIIFSFPWLSLISGIALSREVFDLNGNRISRTAMDCHTLTQKARYIHIHILKGTFSDLQHARPGFSYWSRPPPPGAVVALTHINPPTWKSDSPLPSGSGNRVSHGVYYMYFTSFTHIINTRLGQP